MIAKAESALQFVSPVEREVWVQMGMAVKSEYGDAARDVWMDWSRQADSFRESDARAVWKSFRGTGVTIATLYHEAKIHGWQDKGGFQAPTQEQFEALRKANEERTTREGRERIRSARKAAEKAKWIIDQCQHERHAYLSSKGFPEMEGLVWRPEPENNLLIIPMYAFGKLVGCQMIDKTGDKKYLSGQITAKAEFHIDPGQLNPTEWWTEGFASGLSLKACLDALKQRYRIHITFSANNLKRMAHSGYVVADNDASKTGEEAAKATGLPYWMPETEGQDINDVHKKLGTFKASQEIGRWLRQIRLT